MKFAKKLTIFVALSAASLVSLAQSAWPKIQSDMYPYIEGMQLIRHEQSILLGEDTQQTGLFFANIKNTHSEKVQKDLLADATTKGWQLHSFVRNGTSYVLSLTQDRRILDIRVTNQAGTVEAIYSIVLSQSRPVAAAQPAPAPTVQATGTTTTPRPDQTGTPTQANADKKSGSAL